MKWKPAREVHARVLFFTLSIADDGAVKMQQIPEGNPDDPNSSIMMLYLSPTGAVALHLTWLTGKPAPTSPLRHKGLLAVYAELQKRVPELKGNIAIEHVDDAKVEWNHE